MSLTVVRVEHLTFGYDSSCVLRDVSFCLEQGDYLSIVGPNGSGKSTLIKSVLGILTPQSGQVWLWGQPLSKFRHWNKIGYLPQKLTTFDAHFPGTVGELLEMGIGQRKRQEKNDALQRLGIAHLATRLIGELSYGEQQRALLARALVNTPELLILDEPTTALDPETRDAFYSLTETLNRQNGTTIILVTHDVGIIGRFARRMLYLDKKVIFTGTFSDFCSSAEMTGFFGSNSQHIICHQHDHEKTARGTGE